MTFQLGTPVKFRDTSTEYHTGVIINSSGSTADVLAFTNGNQWSGGQDGATSFSIPQWGISQGTGVGEFVPWPDPTAALSDTFTPADNSRTLNSAFQPSSTRPTLVGFSVRVSSAVTVSGGQAGRIELRSDASNPPTTVRGRVAGGITGTVVVGISLTDVSEGQLTYLVPAGHYVKLVTVDETSTPTYSLNAQYEATL